MIARRLELENFAWYRDLVLDLEPGLTLLVGRNGAGKSTATEGICWVLHGETLRGSSPETSVGPCKGRLFFDDGAGKSRVVRRDRGSKPLLKLYAHDGADLSGQTNTETQGKIDELVGPWERFASTRVFAREFMARFGAATDKDRKALLEGMLGLEEFDGALAAARADLRLQEQAMAGAERAANIHADQVSKLEARLLTLSDPPRPAVDVQNNIAQLAAIHESIVARQEALNKMAASARQIMTTANVGARTSAARVADLKAQATKVEGRRGRLGSGPCPLCQRPVDASVQAAVDAHWDAELAPLTDAMVNASNAALIASQEAEEAGEELSALERQIADLRKVQNTSTARGNALAQELASALQAEGERARLSAELDEVRGKAETARVDVEAGRRRSAVIGAAVEVYGLRGARNLLLGRALDRLNAEANRVLTELGYPIQIQVKGTAVQKSGREVDAISIAVEGPCAPDYRALSTSERARVDTALLLGLAALQSGSDQGLLVFDEVFDSLDEEGVEPLARYLERLAETRQVIVISHHPDVRALFPRGRILRASRGEDGTSRLDPA